MSKCRVAAFSALALIAASAPAIIAGQLPLQTTGFLVGEPGQLRLLGPEGGATGGSGADDQEGGELRLAGGRTDR